MSSETLHHRASEAHEAIERLLTAAREHHHREINEVMEEMRRLRAAQEWFDVLAGYVLDSTDLDLIATITVSLHRRDNPSQIEVAPFVDKTQDAIRKDLLTLNTLEYIYNSMGSDSVFDSDLIAAAAARACVRERQLPQGEFLEEAADWSVLTQQEARVLLDLTLEPLTLSAQHFGGLFATPIESLSNVASRLLYEIAPIAIPDPLARLELICSALSDDNYIYPHNPIVEPVVDDVSTMCTSLDLEDWAVANRATDALEALGSVYMEGSLGARVEEVRRAAGRGEEDEA